MRRRCSCQQTAISHSADTHGATISLLAVQIGMPLPRKGTAVPYGSHTMPLNLGSVRMRRITSMSLVYKCMHAEGKRKSTNRTQPTVLPCRESPLSAWSAHYRNSA